MPGLTAGKHALLSPSSAARWMCCPASVVVTRDMPEDSSPYAIEGTCAHRLAELLLNGADGFPAEEAAKVISAGVDPDSLVEPVRVYVDYVRSLGSEIVTEVSLDISLITKEPEARGTSDAVVFSEGVLHVCDLKYGKGEPVSADGNPQLAIYAGAALAAFGFLGEIREVCMHIVQPRLNSISIWRVSVDELMAFLAGVTGAGARCLRLLDEYQDPDTVPAEFFQPCAKACRFCRNRGKCTALAYYALSAAGLDLPDYTRPTVDGPHLAWLLGKVDLISSWVKAVEKYALEALTAGVDVPGFKLVQGKAGNRKWTDESKAEKLLKAWKVPADFRYVKSLISPTQAEKLLKLKTLTDEQWDELCGYVSREPGKPTVVPASDKRPAISCRPAAEDFPNESVAQ